MIVLDASVILKWFIVEIDSEKATDFKNQYSKNELDIIIPDLLLYEVANALRYKESVDINEINLILTSLFALQLKVVSPSLNLFQKAIPISQDFEVSLYDSTYLALAIELDCYLITAGEKFYKKIILKDKNSKIKLLKNIIIK
ncbi:MAG: type II toxin-antitoxin system VapC family toxin [bacterium]